MCLRECTSSNTACARTCTYEHTKTTKKNPCARNSNTHVHTRKLTHTQKYWYRHQHWTLPKNRHRQRYIDTHNTRTHTHMYKYTHTFVHYLTSVMQSKCWSHQHTASHQRSMCKCNVHGAGSTIPANTTHVHNHSDACSKLVAERDDTSPIWKAASCLRWSAYHYCQLFSEQNWNRRHAHWHAFTVDGCIIFIDPRVLTKISSDNFLRMVRVSPSVTVDIVALTCCGCLNFNLFDASLVGWFQNDLHSVKKKKNWKTQN